jgi:hypothetical protein
MPGYVASSLYTDSGMESPNRKAFASLDEAIAYADELFAAPVIKPAKVWIAPVGRPGRTLWERKPGQPTYTRAESA